MEREQGFITVYYFIWPFWVFSTKYYYKTQGCIFKNIYYLIKVNCLPCWWTIFYRKKKIHRPINFTVGGQPLFSWQHHSHYFHSNFKDSRSSTSINQLIKMIFKFLHIQSVRVLSLAHYFKWEPPPAMVGVQLA